MFGVVARDCALFLIRGQYLQFLVLQKLNPLFFIWVYECVFCGWFDSFLSVFEFMAVALVVGAVLCWDGLKKSVIDFWVLGFVVCLLVQSDGAVGFAVYVLGWMGSVVRCGVVFGSAKLSPILYGILAFVKMSLRFFGLLYPHMSFFSYMWLVVVLLPRKDQFLYTRFLR